MKRIETIVWFLFMILFVVFMVALVGSVFGYNFVGYLMGTTDLYDN